MSSTAIVVIFFVLAVSSGCRTATNAPGHPAALEHPRDRARIWHVYGEEQLKAGHLESAEQALLEAFRLRLLFHDPDLRASYVELSALRLAQGDIRSASILIARARTFQTSVSAQHLWRELRELGKVRLAQGRAREAGRIFQQALDLADHWREMKPGSEPVPLSIAAEIEELEQLFVQAALAQNPPAVLQAFLITEREKAAGFLSGSADSRNRKTEESAGHRNALRRIRLRLHSNEALLSFYLGESSSWLWTLTRNQFTFHRLADKKEITALGRHFREAVEQNANVRTQLGEALYQGLFGEVSAPVRRKPQWLITAGDVLFDIPFAALVVEKKGGNPVYLVEEHSTERVSSALLLRTPSGEASCSGSFLGIGDGIYNKADPRWASYRAGDASGLGESSAQLNRLPASARELEACAREWRAGTPVLLTGPQALRGTFEAALQARPRIIHFAAHVVQPPEQPEQAVIQLGLSRTGRPETLTAEAISRFQVFGSTVVMSGCASAALKPVSGASILGLTRAWLVAGAQAVVGSRWPTPDDSGELFQSFYRDLRNRCDRSPDRRVIGASLQRAQQEMLRSSSWRSNPSYWGAYYVVEKE
jgi:CHAT domain-containing protein